MNEAEVLFSGILDCDRLSLYLNKGLKLGKHKSVLISNALKRRLLDEPLEYILGKTEFMGLEFKVSPDVLIPRQETEILVETVIDLAQSSLPARQAGKLKAQNILDIGTGSGCIAVSLAKFLKNVKVSAIDISCAALNIAKQNALLNNVEVNFLQSDLFSNYELRATAYELIVSNPPYIRTQDIETLEPEIQYEPRTALDGGADGLDFYRRIIKESQYHLKQGGFLIMEMGFDQRDAIEGIFKKSRNFKIIELIKDYNNIDRAVVAKAGNLLSAKRGGYG